MMQVRVQTNVSPIDVNNPADLDIKMGGSSHSFVSTPKSVGGRAPPTTRGSHVYLPGNLERCSSGGSLPGMRKQPRRGSIGKLASQSFRGFMKRCSTGPLAAMKLDGSQRPSAVDAPKAPPSTQRATGADAPKAPPSTKKPTGPPSTRSAGPSKPKPALQRCATGPVKTMKKEIPLHSSSSASVGATKPVKAKPAIQRSSTGPVTQRPLTTDGPKAPPSTKKPTGPPSTRSAGPGKAKPALQRSSTGPVTTMKKETLQQSSASSSASTGAPKAAKTKPAIQRCATGPVIQRPLTTDGPKAPPSTKKPTGPPSTRSAGPGETKTAVRRCSTGSLAPMKKDSLRTSSTHSTSSDNRSKAEAMAQPCANGPITTTENKSLQGPAIDEAKASPSTKKPTGPPSTRSAGPGKAKPAVRRCSTGSVAPMKKDSLKTSSTHSTGSANRNKAKPVLQRCATGPITTTKQENLQPSATADIQHHVAPASPKKAARPPSTRTVPRALQRACADVPKAPPSTTNKPTAPPSTPAPGPNKEKPVLQRCATGPISTMKTPLSAPLVESSSSSDPARKASPTTPRSVPGRAFSSVVMGRRMSAPHILVQPEGTSASRRMKALSNYGRRLSAPTFIPKPMEPVQKEEPAKTEDSVTQEEPVKAEESVLSEEQPVEVAKKEEPKTSCSHPKIAPTKPKPALQRCATGPLPTIKKLLSVPEPEVMEKDFRGKENEVDTHEIKVDTAPKQTKPPLMRCNTAGARMMTRENSAMLTPLSERNSTNYTATDVEFEFKNAPAHKWKTSTQKFHGMLGYHTIGEKKDYTFRSIEKAIEKFRANPHKYYALVFVTELRFARKEYQKYSFIMRKGTTKLWPKQVDPKAPFTIMMHEYLHLPQFPNDELPENDGITPFMTHMHGPLPPPLLPGRGMGICDLPSIKLIGDVDPSDINQGSVSNCWMLSAISALAEFDGAIKKLFRKTDRLDEKPLTDGSVNFYTVSLYDLKTWKEVDIVIDESLCACPGGGGQLLGSKPSEDGELWVPYLEKALAIHCGGWDELVLGQCTHAWAMMTGCREQYVIMKNEANNKYYCTGKYDTKNKRWIEQCNSPRENNKLGTNFMTPWPEVGGGGPANLEVTAEELYARMVAWDKEDFIVSAGTYCLNRNGSTKTAGMIRNHAYSVIDCFPNVAGSGIDLLLVRNPWGSGEIENGDFDDDGPGWDLYPEVKAELNPVDADDGLFYLTKEEFFELFPHIYLSASSMTKYKED